MRNRENVEAIRAMKCSVCMKEAPSDPHHWRTRGAGGTDELTNLVSLCHPHHVEFHTTGKLTFWKKYGRKIEALRSLYGLPELERR